MGKSKQKCRAKTKKGDRCTRNAKFIYCKQHWSKKLKSYTFWGIIALIATIAGLYQDFINPVFETISDKFNPPTYWECSQDQNTRGILFDKANTKDETKVHLLLGLKGAKSWTIESGTKEFWREEPSCALPAGRWGYECAIKYRLNKKRKLFISADLFDSDHCLVGKIFDNRFILNQSCGFTWNFDEKGLEVVDAEFNVVFSLHYYPPNAIAIQGVFYSGGELLLLNDNGIKFLSQDNPREIYEARKTVKPIFEYFGRDWFGKRNPNSGVVKGLRFVGSPKKKITIPKINTH